MKIHIVLRVGPEWSNVVDVYTNLQDANTVAGRKNDAIATSKDIMERLSLYEVVTKTVKQKV